jgi:parallel beta-helix repeat protein
MKRTILLLLLLLSCDPKKVPEEQLNPGDEGTEGWAPTFQEVPNREPCSPGKITSILESSAVRPGVVVDCHLTLEPDDVITKSLIILGDTSSGITIDCNGATIGGEDSEGDVVRIRSQVIDGGWVPVHDVTILNCNIEGSVRIWGMGMNGEGPNLTASSRTPEHVSNARDNAPYHIVLDNVSITGTSGRIPLYISPGVHHSELTNSMIVGESSSVMIYVDAESYGNVIDNNVINASDAGREVIALDGSSYNTISNNIMLDAPEGGIYLYRNCGEAGNIRHSTPSYNVIKDNDIICIHNLIGLDASIYLGSRDGNRGYCDEDAGYPFGSSVSDYDYARFNTISDNSFTGCSIRHGNNSNHSNTID